MSPTVPPISLMTTSAGSASRRARIRVLDLVRDVRDHLDGRAEVLALPLLAQHRVPDRAGRVVRVAREVLVDEPLVVADVEVGLGAVLGDEHLAVLERAHRPGVDVQVRVELLHLDAPARAPSAAGRARRRRCPFRAPRRRRPVTKTYLVGLGRLRRPARSSRPGGSSVESGADVSGDGVPRGGRAISSPIAIACRSRRGGFGHAGCVAPAASSRESTHGIQA